MSLQARCQARSSPSGPHTPPAGLERSAADTEKGGTGARHAQADAGKRIVLFEPFVLTVLLPEPTLQAELALVDVSLLVAPVAVLNGQREDTRILSCLKGANERWSTLGAYEGARDIRSSRS